MVFNYKEREMFHGNQRLSIAELTSADTYKNVKFGTGLVSVSAMSDSAEVKSFAADDIPDHASIAGASLLKGTMKFMQLDPDLRIDFFGQDETENGKGYASTGVFPKRLVQYVTTGTRRNGDKALLITVYPNMSVTGKPSKETETDSSDSPTAITWEASVQASGSEFYVTKTGRKSAEFEYYFYGDEVDKVLAFIDGGGIITPKYKVTDTVPAKPSGSEAHLG
nr:MAG TPA: tail tube protein [Caudoviricetes sp.]